MHHVLQLHAGAAFSLQPPVLARVRARVLSCTTDKQAIQAWQPLPCSAAHPPVFAVCCQLVLGTLRGHEAAGVGIAQAREKAEQAVSGPQEGKSR